MTGKPKQDVVAKAREKEESLAGVDALLAALVNSILDRQLVPLLGAGISTQAWVVPRRQSELPNAFQNVSALVKTVAKQLFDTARSASGASNSLKPLIVKACRNQSLAELCELFVDERAVAQAGEPSKAHYELCETLRIADYVWLQPTRAHRLIAFLACEGLMPEVVTTNYDLCLERAFAESHGVGGEALLEKEFPDDEQPSPRGETSNDFGWGRGVDLRVSHDLDTYRQSAKQLSIRSVSRNEPYLRIHKINGCARAFRRAFDTAKWASENADEIKKALEEGAPAGPPDEEAKKAARVSRSAKTKKVEVENASDAPANSAEEARERADVAARSAHDAEKRAFEAATRILLTERQLQSWRERQWAADMIRDRLRTRKILTCGFGSEEPQVRHTVALITEEEAADGNRDDEPQELFKRPNLIVVGGYDANPTFSQRQVLTAQWNAHSRNGDDPKTSSPYPPYEAFLGPEARANFKFAPIAGNTLTADELWLELYGRVANRLLQAELEWNGPFSRLLRNLVPCGRVLVERLSLHLFGESDKQKQAQQRLFGWCTETATLASDLVEAVDPLATPDGVGSYRSIRESSWVLLGALTVRQSLCVDAVPNPEKDRVALSMFDCTPRGQHRRVRLSVNGPQAIPKQGDDVVLAIGSPYAEPGPVYSAHSVPLVKEREKGEDGFRTIRRTAPVVDLQSLLRAQGEDARDADAFDELLAQAILFPTEPQRQAKRGVRSLNRRN